MNDPILNDPTTSQEFKYISRYCEKVDAYIVPETFGTIFTLQIKPDSLKQFFDDIRQNPSKPSDDNIKQEVKTLIDKVEAVTKK